MSEMFIEYRKKWICLLALISAKEKNHVFTHKTRFTLHILQMNILFALQCEQNTVPQISILFH